MFSTDLSTRGYAGYTVVALRGELDLVDAAAVAAELTAVAAREPGIVVVDLTGLEFIDSCGVAALAHGRRQTRRAGGDLILAAPRPNVTRVLAILRLPEALSVYATVEEAARQAGPSKGRAIPMTLRPRKSRKSRWPRAVMWSRTRGLLALPGSRTSTPEERPSG